jgi:hypothetical protein
MKKFWKSEIRNPSPLPRTLKQVEVSQVDNKIMVSFTLDDGEKLNVLGPMPRFALRETVVVSMHEDVLMELGDLPSPPAYD